MRLLLYFIFSLSLSSLNAQLLDPTKDWFSLEDFFLEKTIQEKGIKSMRMEISDKRDDRIFYDKGELLLYKFDDKGRLLNAMRRIPLSDGHDTSIFNYQYDAQGRIKSIDEDQGPFAFSYRYHYQNDSSFRSIKLNLKSNSLDTFYLRYHSLIKDDRLSIERVSNQAGKAFMELREQYDESGQLLEHTVIYLFNQNEIRTVFTYEDDLLVGKHYQKDFGEKRDQIWKFIYDQELFEKIEIFKSGKIIEKIAFTFENDLPKAIIVRNLQEKFIRIYKCSYQYAP